MQMNEDRNLRRGITGRWGLRGKMGRLECLLMVKLRHSLGNREHLKQICDIRFKNITLSPA